MQLADAVNQLGVDLPIQDILTALNSNVEVSRDSTPYTWAGVCTKLLAAGLGPTDVDAFITNIVNFPGGKSLDVSLNSGGVDFSLPGIQGGLDAIGSALGPDGASLVYALKSIGIQYKPQWEAFGLERIPTEQEIIDATAHIQVRDWSNTIINEIIHPMVTAGNTKAEIITAIQNS